MADDVLFEFLHMEMVSHIYKDQASRAEVDKVGSYNKLHIYSANRLFLLDMT